MINPWLGIALICDALAIVLLVAWNVRNTRRLDDQEAQIRRLRDGHRLPPLTFTRPRFPGED